MPTPPDPAVTLREAEALVAANRLEEAEARIDALPPGTPVPLRLACLRATIAGLRGRPDMAAERFTRIAAQAPQVAEVPLAQATMLSRLGDAAQAIRVLADAMPRMVDVSRRTRLAYRYAQYRIAAALPTVAQPFRPPLPAAPLPELAQVTMLRDEADIIGHNLAHHHALGVRNFLMVDNGSRDDSAAVIADFAARHPDSVVCTVTDRHMPFLQAAKTRAAAIYAQAYFGAIGRPVTWIMPLDADEFVDGPPRADLLAALFGAAATQDVIVLHQADHASPGAVEWDGAGDPYRHFAAVRQAPAEFIAKVFFRAAQMPPLAEGNHAVYLPDLTAERICIAADLGLRLAHLPMRGSRQLARKVQQGAAAVTAAGLAQGYAAHWHAAARDLAGQGEAAARAKLEAFCRAVAGRSA